MATTDDGGSGGDGAVAPVVRGDDGDVGARRRSVAEAVVVSAAVEGDGSEQHELNRAPGELQLRRRAVMLKAAAPAIPGRSEYVKEMREEVAVRVKVLGGQWRYSRRREWRQTEAAAARSVSRGSGWWWSLG